MIKPHGEVLKETKKEIKAYQQGEISYVTTGCSYLDELGVLRQDLIVIGGASFSGKSYELETLKDNIMNLEKNPKSKDYVWLSNSLEMTDFNTTVRNLSRLLKVPKKKILIEGFSEVERVIVNKFFKDKSDARYFLNEDLVTPEEYYNMVREFLLNNIDKDLVVVDFDHSALVKYSGNQKQAMDQMYTYTLLLKKEFKNSLFIYLSQFNREILGRVNEKNNVMAPQRGDFYQSDALFHVADIVYALTTPHKFGVEQYRLVNPKYYDYLTPHFGDIDKKGKISFKTYGRIFIEILKFRGAEAMDFKNIFINQIVPDEEYYKEVNSKVVNSSLPIVDFK